MKYGTNNQAKTREDGKGHQTEVTEKKSQSKAESSPFRELQVVPDRALGDTGNSRKQGFRGGQGPPRW